MRLVVTAGAGFLGTALSVALAADGHDVVCADRSDRLDRLGPVPPNLRTVAFDHTGDAVPEGLLRGCDVLVHLAHRGLPSSPMRDVAREAAENIGGGLRLFESARHHGVPAVVFASSGGTVYGSVDQLPVTESAPTRPISAYGVGKLSIERYLDLYASDFGMRCVSLRVGNAVGEGQFRGAGVGAPAKFLAAVGAGLPVHIWGDGSTVRDYVYVDDVVRAFVAAATAHVPSGAYNVGSGQGHSLDDIVALVRDVTGVEPEVRYEPSRVFDVRSIVLDASRFSGLTGWRAQVPLGDALRLMWQRLAAKPLDGT